MNLSPNHPLNPSTDSEPLPCYASSCIKFTASILGDKWTPRLLFALSNQTYRFCQLQHHVGGINPRTLSKRLSDLEQYGIVSKTIFQEIPPRTEYSLTQKGRDLLPVLEQMKQWGETYSCRLS